jgi:hypothetical protein
LRDRHVHDLLIEGDSADAVKAARVGAVDLGSGPGVEQGSDQHLASGRIARSGQVDAREQFGPLAGPQPVPDSVSRQAGFSSLVSMDDLILALQERKQQ